MLTDYQYRTLQDIREILTVMAIVAGGAWAVLQFYLLYQGDIAGLNRQKLQIELDRHPVMQLELNLKTWQSPRQGHLLEATATVVNVGKLQDVLDLSQQPFRIYPVEFRHHVPTPTGAWHKVNLDFPEIHTSTRLLPNESQSFRVLYQVPEARVYYVEFVVPLSQTSRKHWPAGKTAGDFVWSTGRFIEVVAK